MNTLMIIEVIVSILLITVILLQNKQASLNLATMWGGMEEVTKRWAEKVLYNTTIVLATIFIINAIILFITY